MIESEAQQIIEKIPIGAKLQLIMRNGDIHDVVLASHDTVALKKKEYEGLTVPEMPPALIVQGARWGTYRVDISDIIKIAHISNPDS